MDALGLARTIKPTDLPAPPQAALRIMRACATDDPNLSELSQLTKNDPVLTAELLRVVNSPYFGFTKQVQNISRAITMVGQRSLRNLALCVSVRDALNKASPTGFDTALFWEDAIRRSVCARAIASHARLDQDECFTAGLIQDFGLLALFHLNPDRVVFNAELRGLDPSARRDRELALFGTTHDVAGGILAHAWGLPNSLATSIEHHHQCQNAPHSDANAISQCNVLAMADWMAAVFTARDKANTLKQCRAQLAASFGLEPQFIAELLATVPAQVSAAAGALGLRVNAQIDYEEILREANIQLTAANISYQELTQQLEIALKERDNLQAQLSQELQLAREIQNSLLPTSNDTGLIWGQNAPARTLSGDFFDYFALPDGRMLFNLGDVSGKGINAALLMAKVCSLFRCLGKRVVDVSELLAIINRELFETSVRGMFVTMTAGLYDPRTRMVTLANAGHMPAVLGKSDGKFAKLDAQTPPLGVIPDLVCPVVRFALDDGALYLFSDGATEGRDQQGQERGMTGLLQLFRTHADLAPRARVAAVMGELTATSGALRDDITLLLLEHRA